MGGWLWAAASLSPTPLQSLDLDPVAETLFLWLINPPDTRAGDWMPDLQIFALPSLRFHLFDRGRDRILVAVGPIQDWSVSIQHVSQWLREKELSC